MITRTAASTFRAATGPRRPAALYRADDAGWSGLTDDDFRVGRSASSSPPQAGEDHVDPVHAGRPALDGGAAEQGGRR